MNNKIKFTFEDTGFEVWWDEKNKIIRQKSWGINDEFIAKKITAAEKKLLDRYPNSSILVDGSKVPSITKKASRLFKRFLKKEKINKVVFLQANSLMKKVVNFIAKILKQKYRFFEDEKEAIKWLNEK